MSMPPVTEAYLRAPSGNEARIVLTSIGNKTAASIGWKQMPPSEDDMKASDAAIEQLLYLLTGDPVNCVGSKLFEEDDGGRETMAREQRAFLGGGKG